jgi:hypothetical protein
MPPKKSSLTELSGVLNRNDAPRVAKKAQHGA